MPTLSVTVLTSIDAVLRDSTTFAVLTDVPRAVCVSHDLSQAEIAGTMRRVVSDVHGVIEDEVMALEHSCLSCALREDLLPTLFRLAATGRWTSALLALPLGGEPLAAAKSLVGGTVRGVSVSERLRLAGVVTVLDGGNLTEDLFGDDLLVERGLAHSHDDRRAVGEVLAHQLELADLVLVDDHHRSGGQVAPENLLSHLVPAGVPIHPGPHDVPGPDLLFPRHDPSVTWARADPLRVRPTGAPDGEGAWTLDLHTWKPLHPDRLHDEIEALGAGPIRGRGRFWLPGRPGTVAGWDGAGGQLSIGDVGGWGAAERSTRLVVTGVDVADRERVATAFERVSLTDAELARGRAWWLARDDGFDPWLGERAEAA